jgi:RimJ/RimL family protein N-acetyltransferase
MVRAMSVNDLRGPHVRIRHVRIGDYPELYRIESDPTTAATWRYRAALPPFEQYEEALWKQTDAILVVESLADGSIAGYVQLHDVDLRAGHGWFSIYAGVEHRGRGAVMEGLMLFCDWVFLNTPLRWIYAHSFEDNVGAFESGFRRGESLHLGVLRERVLVGDQLTDVHVIGMERERWLATPIRHRLRALAARRENRDG